MSRLERRSRRAALAESARYATVTMLFLVTCTVCGLVLDLEVGNIAEWIAAFATMGALIAALYAGRAGLGALSLELEREGDRLERERQDQASRIAAWIGTNTVNLMPRFGGEKGSYTMQERGAYVRNASFVPVNDVVLRYVVDGGSPCESHVGVLPPSDEPIFSAIGGTQNEWYDVADGISNGLARVEIAFFDSRGQAWTRKADGRLVDRYAAWRD